MEVVGFLVDLGIDIVPVPGLKPAFEILNFIWNNVQKASQHKQTLRDLAHSITDVLLAVNYVLSQNKLNDHVRVHLDNLERVFNEILLFTEKHVNMTLFNVFRKNVDIDGRIEYFQSRVQYLSRAFTIASIGDIIQKLDDISKRLPPSLYPIAVGSKPQPRAEAPNRPLNKGIRIIDYEPMRVQASFSEPCRMEIRKELPVLACAYFGDLDLSYWGLRTYESKLFKKEGRFDIVESRDSMTWSWSVARQIISVSMHDPAYSDWKNMMEIVFPNIAAARDWFSWLETYASSKSAGLHSQPLSYDVDVRKKQDCWMRKTHTCVERRTPANPNWWVTVDENPRSSKVHSTHFTYMDNSSLPFITVYRNVDTLFIKRCGRAYDEEPTAARRYRFETEEAAKSWYNVWRDCVKPRQTVRGDEPVPVKITFKDPYFIHLVDCVPRLQSTVSSEIGLWAWGLRKSNSFVTHVGAGFEVTTLTTSWTWTQVHNRILVHAAIASQPGWHDSLEIGFHNTMSSEIWFAYLREYCTVGLPSSLPPRAEHVAITKIRVSWVQKTESSILMRTAVSDKWNPIFEAYKSMEAHQSHIALVGRSALPHLRIARKGHALLLEYRASANDSDVPVSRCYLFSSEAEAKAWYEIWEEHLWKVTR